MPDIITSANVKTLMESADFAAFRTSLGLTALATTTPGTGVATALAINVGSAGAFLTFNGNAGTPSALVGTNITGTAAGLTAGSVTNGVTAAAAAAGAGLLWTSGGADKTAVATDTVTTINATTANVTNLLPVSNDGAAIGASGTAFSDLFLASGAVINFNAGNYTLTHSAGVLTANLDLRVTTAGTNSASVVTVGGTQTLTGKSIAASQITAGVLGGNITLGESTGQIILDPTLSADGTWSGIMQEGTAGATLAFGDLVYLAAADSRWELADADAATTAGDVVLGMVVLAAAADGDPTNILLYGKIRADAVFPALTIGAPAYVGTTAGDIVTTQPSGTDDVIRVVGFGLTADVLLFSPSGVYITHT